VGYDNPSFTEGRPFHQYQYSQLPTPYLLLAPHRTNPRVSLGLTRSHPLETSPDRAWRYGNEGGVPASQIINEYGWLWLNRDGSPTTLTDGLYQSLLGADATAAQRRELFSRYLAALTEYWRSRRTCAGVQHFCGLGYSRPTEPRGQTSDHFIDMEKLILEPTFDTYVRDSFMPVGVCIDFWKEEILSGSDAMDVPVIDVNDLGQARGGRLTRQLQECEHRR